MGRSPAAPRFHAVSVTAVTRLASAERGSRLRGDRGSGESRASGLWGSRRGGRGSNGRNRDAVRRGVLLLLLLPLAAPPAASAGRPGGQANARYRAPSAPARASAT